MHFGLVAGVADAELLDDGDPLTDPTNNNEEDFMDLPPDFALIGGLNSDPTSLDEALRGPDAQKWQEALDDEIN